MQLAYVDPNGPQPNGADYYGYIPADLYWNFLQAKAQYIAQNKPFPTHYVVIAGIQYQVPYNDPFAILAFYGETPAFPGQIVKIAPPSTVASPDQVSQIMTGTLNEQQFFVPIDQRISWTTPNPTPPMSNVGDTSQVVTKAGSGSGIAAGAGVILAGIIGAGILFGRKKRTHYKGKRGLAKRK